MKAKTFGDLVIGFGCGALVMTLIIVGLSACGPTPEPGIEPVAKVEKLRSGVYCAGWDEVDPLPRPLGKSFDTYFIHCKHLECLAIVTDDDIKLDCE